MLLAGGSGELGVQRSATPRGVGARNLECRLDWQLNLAHAELTAQLSHGKLFRRTFHGETKRAIRQTYFHRDGYGDRSVRVRRGICY